MRLITVAVAVLSVFFLGLSSLQFQVDRTGSRINASSSINMTGNTGAAYNTSEHILGDLTTTLGVSIPGFMLAALVAFIAVLLWVVLQ